VAIPNKLDLMRLPAEYHNIKEIASLRSQ
jgi:hypothetical protein